MHSYVCHVVSVSNGYFQMVTYIFITGRHQQLRQIIFLTAEKNISKGERMISFLKHLRNSS